MGIFADKDETIQETVKQIAKLPMDAQPGDDFVYGLSTDILGAHQYSLEEFGIESSFIDEYFSKYIDQYIK